MRSQPYGEQEKEGVLERNREDTGWTVTICCDMGIPGELGVTDCPW